MPPLNSDTELSNLGEVQMAPEWNRKSMAFYNPPDWFQNCFNPCQGRLQYNSWTIPPQIAAGISSVTQFRWQSVVHLHVPDHGGDLSCSPGSALRTAQKDDRNSERLRLALRARLDTRKQTDNQQGGFPNRKRCR